MKENIKINHLSHLSRWKTYLWVMVILSMFSIFINFNFRELFIKYQLVNDSFVRVFTLFPNMFLIFGWTLWLMIFGSNIYKMSSFKSLDAEDYEYVFRRYSKYYRIFDMVIAMYFVLTLMTSMFLLLGF